MFRPSNYIAKADLVDGCYYQGTCRNTSTARWCQVTPTFGVFVYLGRKFGDTFVEEIFHPDDGAGYDVFYPLEATEPADDNLISNESFERLRKSIRDSLQKAPGTS